MYWIKTLSSNIIVILFISVESVVASLRVVFHIAEESVSVENATNAANVVVIRIIMEIMENAIVYL